MKNGSKKNICQAINEYRKKIVPVNMHFQALRPGFYEHLHFSKKTIVFYTYSRKSSAFSMDKYFKVLHYIKYKL